MGLLDELEELVEDVKSKPLLLQGSYLPKIIEKVMGVLREQADEIEAIQAGDVMRVYDE